MIIADFYEFAAPFREEDFIRGAAMLFHHLQFTEKTECTSRSFDVKRWVYNLLGYDVSITMDELSAIENIKMAAELSAVDISDDENIRLFAIELQPGARRSQVAYQIHKLFAKAVGDCSTILFAQEINGIRSCMFSIDTGDNLILSDWFTEESDVQSFLAINASYLSSQDARTFQSDLAYAIGRSYYWKLDTPVLIYYDLLQYAERAYVLKDGTYNWTGLHEDVEKIYLQPMKEYGDDYVPPTFGDGRGNTEDFDITSELLEAEFEENSPESLDTEEPFVVSSENESVDEIDGLIEQLGEDFDDPNKLLKALERLDTKPKDLDNEHNTPIKKQGTILVNRTNASSTDSKVVSGEISEKETISEVKRPVQLQQEDTESKENLVDEKISLKANALCVEEPNESPIIKPITETMPETMQADVKVKTDDDWEENSKISEVTKEKDSANSPRQENTVVPLQEEKKRRLTEINQIMIELQNEIQVKEHELQELENKKPKRAFGFARTMKKWYRNIFGKNSAMGKEQVQAEYQLKKEIDALEAKLSELQKERLDYLRTLENE